MNQKITSNEMQARFERLFQLLDELKKESETLEAEGHEIVHELSQALTEEKIKKIREKIFTAKN